MKRRLKIHIQRLSDTINRNTGFLVVLVIVVLGLAILASQKDSQLILEDTQTTVNNTDALLEQREAERIERELAVQRVVEENTRSDEQQTMILCTLILRGNLVITDEEAIQIEQICEEEIRRFQDRGAQSNASDGTTPTQSDQFSQSSGEQSQQANGHQNQPSPSTPSPPPSNDETPPPPPEDRTTIGGFLQDVQETINNLGCSALGVFC